MPVSKTAAAKRRQSKKKSSRKNSLRQSSTYKRASQVQRDMIRDPLLSFARAVRKRRIDPRTVLKHFPSRFRKNSSGRIKAYAVPRRQKTLYIPWFEPGEVKPIPTKSKAERLLLGRWMAALNTARDGDFSKIDKFPKNKRIGGVLLPTKHAEIQQILLNLAEQESPFEGLYRTIVRRR
jgi:hypothetical protein